MSDKVEIIGTIFKKREEYGDFDFMIRSGEYPNSLFIYNDNTENRETYKKGAGNAVIRCWNQYNPNLDKPYSAGICTGSLKEKGFSELTEEVKTIIREDIKKIKNLIILWEYESIYYSADKNGLIGTAIFKVGEDVKEYITKKINSLEI